MQPRTHNSTIKVLCLVSALSCMVQMTACNDSRIDDPAEYERYIGMAEKGLVRMRTANSTRLELRYLPPEFLALKEKVTSAAVDRGAVEDYRNSMTFMLRLESTVGEEDIMMRGIRGYDDYRNRTALLNFDIKDYARLETPDTAIVPVLGTIENTYGLTPTRTIILVFAASARSLLQGTSEFNIVFADPAFGTGVNRFSYRTTDILNVPTVKD